MARRARLPVSVRASLVCCLFVVFGLACGSDAVSPTMPVTLNEDTTLGAGDVFEVRVYGEEGLSGNFRVAADGTIDFPFVGRTRAAGLEPGQVADGLRTGLVERGILVNPQVSVMVTEYNSKRISVMGAVTSAGTFPITSGLTVVQAISLAGGFTPLANKNGTVVTRLVDGQPQQFVVPVESIARGRGSDIPLRAGDIVFVPERVF